MSSRRFPVLRAWKAMPVLLAVLMWVSGLEPLAQASQFKPAMNYPVGNYPFAIAVGDFNRDGIPDFAVANYTFGAGDGSVSILLGRRNGTFRNAGTYSSNGSEVSSIVAGDFNGDGKLDLLVANSNGVGEGASNVSLLVGEGDGRFRPAVIAAAVPSAFSLASADLNGDGKLDFVVLSRTGVGYGTYIYLGHSDGTFEQSAHYASGINSVVIADFNQDGKPDLAVAVGNENEVSIFLGHGDGTFAGPVNYAAGYGPDSVAIGDFNGDGKIDLVVANAASFDNGATGTTVSVLLGRGDGTFQPPMSSPAGQEPVSVAVADFNGDGRQDLIVADFGIGSGDVVSLLLGNGNGTFHAPVEFTVGTGPVSVTAADLNRDGLPDVLVANADSNDVSVLINTDNSTCSLSPEINDLSAEPNVIRPADGSFVPVFVSYQAVSRCGSTPTCKLSVSSDPTVPRHDWSVLDAHHIDLLAKVTSGSEERTYRIGVRCTDTDGNSVKASTTVTVRSRP